MLLGLPILLLVLGLVAVIAWNIFFWLMEYLFYGIVHIFAFLGIYVGLTDRRITIWLAISAFVLCCLCFAFAPRFESPEASCIEEEQTQAETSNMIYGGFYFIVMFPAALAILNQNRDLLEELFPS